MCLWVTPAINFIERGKKNMRCIDNLRPQLKHKPPLSYLSRHLFFKGNETLAMLILRNFDLVDRPFSKSVPNGVTRGVMSMFQFHFMRLYIFPVS